MKGSVPWCWLRCTGVISSAPCRGGQDATVGVGEAGGGPWKSVVQTGASGPVLVAPAGTSFAHVSVLTLPQGFSGARALQEGEQGDAAPRAQQR